MKKQQIAPKEPAASAQRLTAMHIRWMIRRDMPEVMAIEEECFLNEWTLPWQEEDFIRQLRKRNVIGMVVDGTEQPFKDRVLGYMVYESNADHIFLLNFAVAEQVQRRGIGTEMVQKLRSKLWGKARHAIVAHLGGPWKHGTPGASGAIDCPVCNGVASLRFSRAGYNGHIHAGCSTKDCVSWME